MSWGEAPSTDSAGMKTNDLHILTVQNHFGFITGRVSQFDATCIHCVMCCILHEYKGKSIKTLSVEERGETTILKHQNVTSTATVH